MQLDEKIIFENIEVITTLEKWKVLSLREVKAIMDIKKANSSVYKRFSILEEKGVIQKIRIRTMEGKSIFAITLTEKIKKKRGLKYEGDHFLHDLMVSSVASGFQTLPGIIDIFFEHETFSSENEDQLSTTKFHPDALIVIDSGKRKPNFVAVEVENSRKSEARIQTKFLEYGQSDKIDLVSYFFNDPGLMAVYIRALRNIESDKLRLMAEKKIAFVFVSDFLKTRESLFIAEAIFNYNKTNLKNILGNI